MTFDLVRPDGVLHFHRQHPIETALSEEDSRCAWRGHDRLLRPRQPIRKKPPFGVSWRFKHADQQVNTWGIQASAGKNDPSINMNSTRCAIK
jgi:hypothetical protein